MMRFACIFYFFFFFIERPEDQEVTLKMNPFDPEKNFLLLPPRAFPAAAALAAMAPRLFTFPGSKNASKVRCTSGRKQPPVESTSVLAAP